jgi:hypothetical protein
MSSLDLGYAPPFSTHHDPVLIAADELWSGVEGELRGSGSSWLHGMANVQMNNYIHVFIPMSDLFIL